MIAVDEHQHSKTAFDWFLDNVYRKDDLVVICHVPEAPSLPTFSLKHGIAPPVDAWQKAMTEKLDRIRKLEESYEADLIQKKIRYKFSLEQGSRPGPGIMAVVQREQADLLVMGARGLDPLRRVFLGSVSEFAVHNCDIPIVICPASGLQ